MSIFSFDTIFIFILFIFIVVVIININTALSSKVNNDIHKKESYTDYLNNTNDGSNSMIYYNDDNIGSDNMIYYDDYDDYNDIDYNTATNLHTDYITDPTYACLPGNIYHDTLCDSDNFYFDNDSWNISSSDSSWD